MKKIIGNVLSSLYLVGLRLSQFSYRVMPFRIRKVGARVISVGNITWGGTGKTPLVARLARELTECGKRVAVLTRGYGQDEVEELRKKLPSVPILVGRDRIRTAKEAVRRHGAEVVILDDGFQHIRLHRDLDIVNINSTLPFGPGGLIPVGTLREPVAHLGRADIFVLTKSNLGSKNLHWIRQRLLDIKPGAVIFEAVHRPIRLLDIRRNRSLSPGEMKGKKVAALSGIGDPHSFEKMVENLGAEIVFAARFGDHHRFMGWELLDLARRCKGLGVREVVTTEKDFFRIGPLLKSKRAAGFAWLNFLVLEIEFQIIDEEDFIRRCLNS